jgi:hypothetical protein
MVIEVVMVIEVDTRSMVIEVFMVIEVHTRSVVIEGNISNSITCMCTAHARSTWIQQIISKHVVCAHLLFKKAEKSFAFTFLYHSFWHSPSAFLWQQAKEDVDGDDLLLVPKTPHKPLKSSRFAIYPQASSEWVIGECKGIIGSLWKQNNYVL